MNERPTECRIKTCVGIAAAIAATSLVGGCQPTSSGPVVVCFGDSITEQGGRWGGYVRVVRALMKEACPGLNPRVIAAGVSGSRVPDLERRYAADVAARHPAVVVVMIGINDVWHTQRGGGTSKSDFDAGLRRLVQKMLAADIRVLLCTPTVIGEKPDGTNPLDDMLDDYADIIRDAAALHGAALVDLRREFKEYLTAHNPHAATEGILTYDGVHLTAAGNRLVAHAVAARIVSLLRCQPTLTQRPP